MKKHNLLIVTPGLGVGGAEKMLVQLANRLDKNKFSVGIVSLSAKNPLSIELLPAASTLSITPRRWRYDLGPAIKIREMINQQHIDSVLAFDLFGFFYVWAALQGVAKRPKIFISIHSTTYRNTKNYLQNLIYARLLSGREKFISVCNTQAEYWSRMYRIPRHSFSTIYNGVDTATFHLATESQKISARNSLNIPERAFVIVQVASLTPHKRHVDSIMAFNQVLNMKTGTPLYLFMVGGGSEEMTASLTALVNKMGLNEKIIFCGNQQDVRPFYEAADLFTLSSNNETFSMAALEAMSMGIPCVLTDIGGAREMITEGVNGCLVAPNDPGSLANGWLNIMENRHKFIPGHIRNIVRDRFEISRCVSQYQDLILRDRSG
jgi:glycosyltransferase involved in cell wall biosynthesis